MPLLIFDLDGTLLDSRESILASIRHAFGQIGYGSISFNEEAAVLQDLATTFRETADSHQIILSPEQWQIFIRSYHEDHSRNPKEHIRVYPNVIATLEKLKTNYRLAVATTKHTEQARLVVRELELAHFFEHIQGTDPGMRYKPAPDILNAVLKVLSEPAATAIYIGDSRHDMGAAREAGMLAVGSGYGYCGREALKTMQPDWIIDNFADLLLISSEILSRVHWNHRKNLSEISANI